MGSVGAGWATAGVEVDAGEDEPRSEGMENAKNDKQGRKERSVPRVVEVRPAGERHQVVTVVGGKGGYRRRPCDTCPWKRDVVGEFPAEAFRHSAGTAYDMADRTFACHESGTTRPAICAGFLLRGSDHNLKVRLARMKGEIQDDVTDGGEELFDSYREMAIANGVGEGEEVLQKCRDD